MDFVPVNKSIDLEFVDVVFELTRWCNMECPHCLRGEKEKLRIKKQYIDALFSKVTRIGTLMFTGGEPTLAIDLMEYAIESMIHHHVTYNHFWISTNGLNFTKRIQQCLLRLFSGSEEKELNGLQVSIDNYHTQIDAWKIENWADREVGWLAKLDMRGSSSISQNLLFEGRAKENYGEATRKPDHNIRLFYGGKIEGVLYVNVKGNILSSCDLSYKSADRKNSRYVVSHVNNNIIEDLEWFFLHHLDRIYAND
jgi:organic radical activating enzyme